jgi:hypothetical protein
MGGDGRFVKQVWKKKKKSKKKRDVILKTRPK